MNPEEAAEEGTYRGDGDASDGTSLAQSPPQPPRSRPSRRTLALIVTPIVALIIMTNIGDVIGYTLVKDHPLWQIALNSRKRWLVLASPRLDAFSYYTVGLLRQLVADPPFYFLGLFYGDAAVRWMERKTGNTGSIELMEKWFRKAAYPMVAIMPNNLICLLAGAARMPLPAFFVANVGGSIASLAVIRILGDVFGSPITSITNFLHRYRWWFIAFSAIVITYQIWDSRRKGRSQLESIDKIEEELQLAEQEVRSDARTAPLVADNDDAQSRPRGTTAPADDSTTPPPA